MKKLTAGIFTVLIGLCAANSADAAIASKAWVEQDFATKTSLANEKSALQGEIALKANASDVYTKGEVYTKTEADATFEKIGVAQAYTDKQVEALAESLNGSGEGDDTGIAGTVLKQTSQIGSLETKVGDKTVAQSITDALATYTNTEGMNAAIKVVADDLAEHELLASQTYATIANLGAANDLISGLDTSKEAVVNKVTVGEGGSLSEEQKKSTTLFPSMATTSKMISDANVSIENQLNSITSAEDGILAQAEGKINQLANGAVATNTQAIADLTDTVSSNATAAANATTAVANDLAAYKTSNNAAVSANADAIAAIKDAENGILKQAKDYTDTEIDALEQSLNGTSTNLTELSGKVTKNTEDIAANAAAIAAEEARAKLAEEANAAAAAAAKEQADKGVADAKAAAEAAAANAKTLADQAALISTNSGNIATNAANIQTNADNIAANTAKFGNYTETKDLSILAKENIPTECSDNKNKCVLTYGTTTAGALGFEWEVVERETVTE